MADETTTSARVVQDARSLLRTVRDEVADGRKPYASDVRRLIERGLALRFAEYVQFLERYGFLSLNRKTDLIALTRAGEEVAGGDESRLSGLEGDARYHFGDKLTQGGDSPGPAAAPQGERLDKRYLRFEAIGRGGLGSVWRGQQLTIDRPVALKLLDGLFDLFTPDQHDEILRRLELAVREHAQLVSPFVIQILDQNTSFETPYYVMELAPGGNLRQLLASGPLPPAVALRYFIQIALGLKAAHAQGLEHRDLKPENVLLDAQGNVKLSDFGITRVAERDGRTVRQAYVGYGSVGYMAPELFRGGGAGSGAQADVYALGIVLYEMLVGDLPGRRSPMPSEVAEGIPSEIDDIFDSMAQDDPARRPTDIDSVLARLWTAPSIVALLDARQAPYFVEPPVALPGLAAVDMAPPRPAVGQRERARATTGEVPAGAIPEQADDANDDSMAPSIPDTSLAGASVELAPAPAARRGDSDPPTAEAPSPALAVAVPVASSDDESVDDDSVVDEPDPAIFEAHGMERFDDGIESIETGEIELVDDDILSTSQAAARLGSGGPAQKVTDEERRRLIDEKLKRLRRR